MNKERQMMEDKKDRIKKGALTGKALGTDKERIKKAIEVEGSSWENLGNFFSQLSNQLELFIGCGLPPDKLNGEQLKTFNKLLEKEDSWVDDFNSKKPKYKYFYYDTLTSGFTVNRVKIPTRWDKFKSLVRRVVMSRYFWSSYFLFFANLWFWAGHPVGMLGNLLACCVWSFWQAHQLVKQDRQIEEHIEY